MCNDLKDSSQKKKRRQPKVWKNTQNNKVLKISLTISKIRHKTFRFHFTSVTMAITKSKTKQNKSQNKNNESWGEYRA
jgi:ribosomal protein L11